MFVGKRCCQSKEAWTGENRTCHTECRYRHCQGKYSTDRTRAPFDGVIGLRASQRRSLRASQYHCSQINQRPLKSRSLQYQRAVCRAVKKRANLTFHLEGQLTDSGCQSSICHRVKISEMHSLTIRALYPTVMVPYFRSLRKRSSEERRDPLNAIAVPFLEAIVPEWKRQNIPYKNGKHSR